MYTDSGFDEFFQREILPVTSTSASEEDISSFDLETRLQGLNLNKVVGGLFTSSDGRVQIDLENNKIIISDGLVERVRLGALEDGSYGLLIKDANGKELMQISGTTNTIKSADNSLEINFNDTRLLVRDEGGTPIVLLGKF